MRINFILPALDLSGGIKVVVTYAKILSQMGHQVLLIAPPAAKIPPHQKFRSWLKGNGWPHIAPRRESHVDGSGIDFKILDRWRPVINDDVPTSDVVIATWWETAEWVNALSPEKGAKVYFIQHHEIFPYLPVERCRATYRLPAQKIVVSRWLQEIMSAVYFDNQVELVPNSVDRSQFFASVRGKQPVPTVGLLYSSVPFKGLKLANAALEIVRQHIPHLRIIAFGSEIPCPELPLLDNCEYYHSPAQERIRQLYSQCDVWITASQTEGFNLPALEAMACRTPVVATRTGWPAESVKSGWNGYLVEVDDYKGLAEGTEWVISRSEEEWKQLSLNAFATSSSGSWEQSAKTFENALQRAYTRSL